MESRCRSCHTRTACFGDPPAIPEPDASPEQIERRGPSRRSCQRPPRRIALPKAHQPHPHDGGGRITGEREGNLGAWRITSPARGEEIARALVPRGEGEGADRGDPRRTLRTVTQAVHKTPAICSRPDDPRHSSSPKTSSTASKPYSRRSLPPRRGYAAAARSWRATRSAGAARTSPVPRRRPRAARGSSASRTASSGGPCARRADNYEGLSGAKPFLKGAQRWRASSIAALLFRLDGDRQSEWKAYAAATDLVLPRDSMPDQSILEAPAAGNSRPAGSRGARNRGARRPSSRQALDEFISSDAASTGS